MKSVRIHEHGGPEVLRYEDAPEPKIGRDQVLVKVAACSLNHLDLFIRSGLPGLTLKMPHILGSDASGQVAEVGEVAGSLKVGDQVLIAPGLSCRYCTECVSGNDNCCRHYGLLGYAHPGVNAEYVAVPAINAIRLPGNLSFQEAAAVPLVFLTAWHMLVGVAKIKMGEDVLIVGASSGIGTAAIQIAKLHHCRVIATAGSEAKMAMAKQIGADEVINHYKQGIKSEVQRITEKRGVDIVFEHVGAATWAESTSSLANHGRLVTCGATTGGEVKLNIHHLFFRQLTLNGTFMGTLGELHKVVKLFELGKLKAVVDQVFPLSELGAAHRYLESKSQFGKVVISL
jgi:NADPH:quinone reductase-like Zn-dependent oxidoreductase